MIRIKFALAIRISFEDFFSCAITIEIFASFLYIRIYHIPGLFSFCDESISWRLLLALTMKSGGGLLLLPFSLFFFCFQIEDTGAEVVQGSRDHPFYYPRPLELQCQSMKPSAASRQSRTAPLCYRQLPCPLVLNPHTNPPTRTH